MQAFQLVFAISFAPIISYLAVKYLSPNGFLLVEQTLSREDKNMTAAMIKLAVKLGPRIPELLARAAIGDPTAIAALAVLGIAAVGAGIESAK